MANSQGMYSRTPDEYCEDIALTAKRIPTFKRLDEFLKQPQRLDASSTKITWVRFLDGLQPQIEQDCSLADLAHHATNVAGSNLFIVEDVDAEVISFLGGRFDVDPQFFLDHIDNSRWYCLGEIEKHLPALKSAQMESQFLRFRFVSPRELLLKEPIQVVGDRIEPDPTSTKVPRVAGALNPTERDGIRFFPLALTRQSVAVWFDISKDSKDWKTGIILLDPAFQPEKCLGQCLNPSYRMFASRNSEDIDSSYCASFINCLRHNEKLKKGDIPSPFVLLRDLYRIIASEWIVVNTCLERELNTIEWRLEREEPRLKHLERYLKGLFISRRRITLYETLVQEQLGVCRMHGRKFWDKFSNPDEPRAVADTVETLETDFGFVANLLQRNGERVARNINLLTALISVEESRVGIAKSKSLEALTVAATVFLPFTLVASIMNMNGAFAPGQAKHWVFWAFSVPISLVVVTFYMIYRKVGSKK